MTPETMQRLEQEAEETLKLAYKLKNKITKTIKSYGIKSHDLLQSVEFILNRKF